MVVLTTSSITAPLIKRITAKERQSIVMPNFLHDSIVGHLLGDGFMVKRGGIKANARFGFTQSSNKEEYFNNVFSNFKILCTSSIQPQIKFFTTNKTNLSSISFLTMQLPCLNVYYDLFYKNGQRQVPLNIIDLLSPIGLSY